MGEEKRRWKRLFSGPPSKASWMEHLTHKDWLLDGAPIRGSNMLAMWEGLDWSKAYCDMGPSVAGNPGPYWHVPYPAEETVHRLYPKVLATKWLPLIRQAVAEEREGYSSPNTKRAMERAKE
jgi:hypothetical protein